MRDSLDRLIQDLRDAARALRRRPAFTAATVVVLALGIGANTAMFSLVDAVVLRALPFRDPDRLVWLWHTWAGGDTGVFAIPDVIEYRARNRSMEQIAGFTGWGANLTDRGEPERLVGVRVTGNFFSVLGVETPHGRPLVEADDEVGKTRVAVLTDRLWQRRFGGDPAVIGRPLTLNGDAYIVVGVLPRDFLFPVPEAEIAVPLVMDGDPYRGNPGMNFLRLLGRLRPGVDIQQATSDLGATTEYLRRTYPDDNAGKYGVRLVRLQDEITGGHRLTLFMLLGAVGFVLLMTCSNLANLLLTHTAARRKEFAVRSAVGGGRRRLVRQVMCENLVLSILGGIAGAFVAWACVEALGTILPAALPRGDRAAIDVRVLSFSLILSVGAGVLFGTWPAVNASKADPLEGLRSQERGVVSGSRFESLLLVSQVAIALTLLVGTGLFLRSFARLQSVAPGFSLNDILTMRLSLPRREFADREAIARFHDALVSRIGALPDGPSASLVSVLPLSGGRSTTTFTVAGRPAPAAGEEPIAHYRVVGPEYFRVMRIAILHGRAFDSHDDGTAPAVAIVNDSAARRLWPRGDAVGATIALENGDAVRIIQIVGVARDVKHLGLDLAAGIDLYVPLHQIRSVDVPLLTNSVYLVARTTSNPMTLAGPARQALHSINRNIAASSVRTMNQVMEVALAPRRFTVLLLEVFAAAALLLAFSGVYAMTAQLVSRRTREIGVRLALGAARRDILALIARRSLAPVVVGVVVGLAGATAVALALQHLLFEISGLDPAAFAGGGMLMLVAAVIASTRPALRAMRILPRPGE